MDQKKTKIIFKDLSNLKLQNEPEQLKDSMVKLSYDDTITKLLKQSDMIVQQMKIFTSTLQDDGIKIKQINFDLQVSQQISEQNIILDEQNFLDQESFLFEEPEKTPIEQIVINAQQLNLDLSQTTHIFQDVVKHFYMHQQIYMVCFYPLDQIPQLIKMINLSCYGAKTLVLGFGKEKNNVNNSSQIKYESQAKPILDEEIQSLVQIIKIDDKPLQIGKKTLLIIPQITPVHAMKEFLIKNEINTEFYGPTLLTNFQSEQTDSNIIIQQNSQANYLIKPIVFLQMNDQESSLVYLKNLLIRICNRGQIFIKVDNIQNLRALDSYLSQEEFRYKSIYSKKDDISLINLEIVASFDLNMLSSQLQSSFKSIIHLDIPNSFTEYINELLNFDQSCVSFVLASPIKLIAQRNYLLKDYIDQKTFVQLIEEIQGCDSTNYFDEQIVNVQRINLVRLQNKYNLDEQLIMKLINYLKKEGKLTITGNLPTQLRLSMFKEIEDKSDLEITLSRSIKQFGRRLLSLRQQSNNLEHYQVPIKVLSDTFGLSTEDLMILIKSSDQFIEPEYFDYELDLVVERLEILNPFEGNEQVNDLEQMYSIIMKFKDNKFTNDLDIKVQINFQQYVNDYFNNEDRIIEEFVPPYKSFTVLKHKNQLQKDIQLLGQSENIRDILQIFLGNNQKYHKQWLKTSVWSKYSEFNHKELLSYIQECYQPQNQQLGHREQGWMIKKIKI